MLDAVSVKHSFPALSAVNSHRCAAFRFRVPFNLGEQWKPAVSVVTSARRQDANFIVRLHKLRGRRRHDLATIPSDPHQLHARQNIAFDVRETAQPGTLNCRPDLVANMRPHLIDARRIDAD